MWGPRLRFVGKVSARLQDPGGGCSGHTCTVQKLGLCVECGGVRAPLWCGMCWRNPRLRVTSVPRTTSASNHRHRPRVLLPPLRTRHTFHKTWERLDRRGALTTQGPGLGCSTPSTPVPPLHFDRVVRLTNRCLLVPGGPSHWTGTRKDGVTTSGV